MRNKAFKFVLLFAALLLLVAAFSAAAREPEPQFVEALGVPAAKSGVVIEPKGAVGEAVYIVRLEDAPLANYHGGVQGLDATSPTAAGSNKLDVNSTSSVAYRDYLASKQSVFLAATEQNLGREVDAIYQYDVVYNGVAMTMTPAEASSVAKQPGVVTVQRDKWRQAQTDVTPAFIGADEVWDGSGVPGVGTKGEGVIVGIIDTGIWPEHPSFDESGIDAPPVSWNGGCQVPADGTPPVPCTNKLIGAKYFLAGYSSAVGGYDGLFESARDDSGHGTHTASTAAGNENVAANLLGVDRGTISGIAPRAHVAAYKGLGPQGGLISDLVAAINEAVKDGVDVINYSIGSSASDPWADPDSLAFLAARNAGVFVATSAGNAGPGADTVGSPGNAPWITTVGASTSSRLFISDITLTGPELPPTGLYGASVTAGVTDFDLVDAEGIADSGGDATGRCINPYPAETFNATDVVLCQRGAVARVIRGDNVRAGGGGGVILYNASPAQGLATDNYVIPAVHVLNAAGMTIKNYLTANPSGVKISFTTGEKAVEGSDARVKSDMMADFSSRGPNGLVLDVIKPDVTAPGVQILAGNTPDCIDPIGNGCGAEDELFMAIQGTSMSSPHVAGAAALLTAVHPDWTPSEIESALMTTANTKHVKEDGSTQADPFDMGGGRIDLPRAANAPLVLHETNGNYLAADPAFGGDPKTLNNASLGNSSCQWTCSWTRTVRNSSAHAVTWDASVMGFNGSVSPASFTLAPGATQTLTAVVSVAGLEAGVWAFGSVEIVPQTGGSVPEDLPSTQLPIAVMPVTVEITINTRRDAGSYLMADQTAIEITDMTLEPYGLVPGQDSQIKLKQDPTNGDPYDDLSQVWYQVSPVPAGAMRFVNEILDSTTPDAELFVGFDDNGNGKPDAEEEVCSSTTGSWDEYCSIDKPKNGDWWVLVQNWASSDADAFDSLRVATAVVPGEDSGNMTFDAPNSVPALEPFDITVKYDLVNSYAGQAWFGSFSVGADAGHPGNVGKVNVDLYRLEDDVVKSAGKQIVMPGDNVKFTIKVNSNVLNEDVDYKIVDMIPDGLTYVAGSAEASSGTVVVDGSKLTWTGTLTVQPRYNMSTSVEDELCDTGFGGYVNLEDVDPPILTQEAVFGDSSVFGFFGTGNAINFYGIDYTGMFISDDGFAVFDQAENYGGNPWTPQEIPNVKKPSNLAAMLWQDMEIVYDKVTNKGVSAATVGDNVMIVEYDDIQIFEDDTNTYDFEIVMTRAVDNTPGAYEIVFAYDNLNGSLDGPLTIGVENAAGDNATAFENNGSAAGDVTNGMMICFDYTVTEATITYEATVDHDVISGDELINMAKSSTSNVNSKEEMTSASVHIFSSYKIFNPIVVTSDAR